jgi:hypothetical protein
MRAKSINIITVIIGLQLASANSVSTPVAKTVAAIKEPKRNLNSLTKTNSAWKENSMLSM